MDERFPLVCLSETDSLVNLVGDVILYSVLFWT